MIASALLRDSIEVEAFQGDTATGPMYGPATTYPARLSTTARMVRTATGEDRQVVVVAVVRPDAQVPARSRVTIDGCSYVVLVVSSRMQLTRPMYTELSLGWAA